MSLPTCAVLCSVFDDAGNPVAGATITAKLNQFEVYGGYVVPMDVSGTTDSTGTCTLNLWPNALGSTESMYAVKIVSPNGKTLRTSAVVPHTTSANLHQIAELPAYDGKTDGQLILTDAVTAGATAVSAATAASGSATAAAGSATAALASQTAAAASQASAAVYSANASGFATAASASAGAAGTSATAAAGSAATATTKASESAASAVTSAASAATSTTKAAESAASATASAGSAATATTQAGNASTSAAASSGSATASALSASESEASRIAAGLSAAAAAVSATSAGTSAASASGSASTASTKASESATSATASAASAVTATAQAVIATTQAGYASTSEANALIYSVTATTKATAAQISASASADSANSSAASATASAGSAANALSTYTSMVGVYGSITAVNTAVTNAGNSATAAAASAASALSIYGSTSAVSAAVSAASGSATAAANSATAAAASAVTAAGYTVPSQTGNGGKFLTTNGTAVSWDNALTAVAANTYGILKLVGNSRGGEIDFYNGASAIGGLWVDASSNMVFGTGSGLTERARIDSGGNFGIGKTPGNEKLGVKIATDTNFVYGLNVARNANDSFFAIGYNTTIDGWQIGAHYVSTGAYKPVTLWTNNTERMRINTNGNIGIGKTSGGGLIEAQLTSDANYSYGINVFRLANDSQFGIGYNSTSDAWQMAASFGSTGAYKPITFWTSSAERMRIDAAGNVGIGVSPTLKLDVNGGIGLIDNAILRLGSYGGENSITYVTPGTPGMLFKTAGAEVMRLTSAGKVGIGVGAPKAYVDLFTPALYTAGQLASSMLHLYNPTTVGSISQMTFGYTGGSNAAAYFGYVSTSAASSGNGDLVWGNRNVTTDTAAPEVMRMTAAGNLLVGKTSTTANAGDIQLSKGIAFPATQVSCSDANTLDDYEEGTWTPVVRGLTTAGAGTYSLQIGLYTKIGNLVTVQMYLNVTAHTGTGAMAIDGFPFAAASGVIQPVNIPWVNNLAMSAGNVPCSYIGAGGVSIVMSQMPSGGGAVTSVPIDASFEMMLSASYRV